LKAYLAEEIRHRKIKVAECGAHHDWATIEALEDTLRELDELIKKHKC
jgi:hypothetical protein